jgi:hypothetical protein
VNFLRWLKYRFSESGRPWWGSDLRCRKWQAGAFNTDWQCLLVWNHEEVEQLPHIFEPDLWPGGCFHDEWTGRGGLAVGRQVGRYDRAVVDSKKGPA